MQKINKQKTFNFFKRKTKWLGIIDYKTLTFYNIYFNNNKNYKYN